LGKKKKSKEQDGGKKHRECAEPSREEGKKKRGLNNVDEEGEREKRTSLLG